MALVRRMEVNCILRSEKCHEMADSSFARVRPWEPELLLISTLPMNEIFGRRCRKENATALGTR